MRDQEKWNTEGESQYKATFWAGHQCGWLVPSPVGIFWGMYTRIRGRSIYPLDLGLLWLRATLQSINICTLLHCTYMNVKQDPADAPLKEVRETPRQETQVSGAVLRCAISMESSLKPCGTFCQSRELRLWGCEVVRKIWNSELNAYNPCSRGNFTV